VTKRFNPWVAIALFLSAARIYQLHRICRF
jgi:hypothetical protein